MEVNTQHGKKMLASAMALSLVLSGCLLIGNSQATAAGSAGVSSLGVTAQQDSMQELKTRWRKETAEFRKGGMPIIEEAASVLGMEKEALKQELAAGKSILDVASAKGISEATLTEKLIASRSAKLEEAVKAGSITRERADEIKTKMQSHIGFKLKQKGLGSAEGSDVKGHHTRKQGGLLPHLGPDKLSAILGISKEQLMAELKAGKSLADIAKDKGMSKDELIAKIKDELTPALEKAIERKPLMKDEKK
jgi:hypothetical protein